MALEDYLESEVAVAVAATAALFSPRLRKALRRGAVYGLAGALIASDGLSTAARSARDGAQAAARSVRQGVQQATVSAQETVQQATDQIQEEPAKSGS